MEERQDRITETLPKVIGEQRFESWKERLGFGSPVDARATIVLLSSVLLLIAAWHWDRPPAFRGTALERSIVDFLGTTGVEYEGTLSYLFWGVAATFWRIIIPLGIIVLVLRRRPVEYGFRLKGILPHLPLYGLLYLLMLPIVLWVSTFDSFLQTYPFYDLAAEGGLQFWLYQGGYMLQFVALEAFFRGYMVFGLRERFGAAFAVMIMTIPYVMIHFGKPVPEIFAAVGAGLILGHLALRSKSWIPGVFLHISVALTMDVLAITRGNGSFVDTLGLIF